MDIDSNVDFWKCSTKMDGEGDDDIVTDAKVAEVFARSSPMAMSRIRDAVSTAAERSFSEQLDVERDHQRVLIPLNMAEGADAFLEKREPDFAPDRG